MTARRPALHAAAGLAVLVFVVSVPAATAAPPPQELCGVCGSEFATVTAQEGVGLNVEHSTATVTFDRNGSGHWHARVRVTPAAAERLAANATLRDHVVRETYRDGRTLVDDPRNLTTRVENGTLVVEFDVPGVTRRGPGGVVLVTMLSRGESVTLDADRVTLAGPTGTVVTRGVAGMATRGRTLTWERQAEDDRQSLRGTAMPAFAPDGGPVGGAATWVATLGLVGLRAGDWVVVLAAGAALSLGGLVALQRDARAAPTDGDPDSLATPLAVAGGVLTAGLAALALATGVGPPALLAGVAAVTVGAALSVVDGRHSLARVGARAVAAVAVGAGLAAATGDAGALAVAVGVAACLPLGFVRLPRGVSLALATGAMLVVPTVLVLVLLVVTVVGAPRLVLVVLLGWAVAASLCGVPLAVIGNRLARQAPG